MRNLLLSAAAALVLSSLAAAPAFAASASGDASVTVLRALTVTKNADLTFGTVVRPATTGTVEVTTAGARNFTGGVTGVGAGFGNADFTVAGEGGQAISVTVPATITLANGGDNLTVNTSNTGSGSQTLSGSLGGAGSHNVKVGGTITILSTTATGTYTGPFLVSTDYQ